MMKYLRGELILCTIYCCWVTNFFFFTNFRDLGHAEVFQDQIPNKPKIKKMKFLKLKREIKLSLVDARVT